MYYTHKHLQIPTFTLPNYQCTYRSAGFEKTVILEHFELEYFELPYEGGMLS
jgi:hypothetical protein